MYFLERTLLLYMYWYDRCTCANSLIGKMRKLHYFFKQIDIKHLLLWYLRISYCMCSFSSFSYINTKVVVVVIKTCINWPACCVLNTIDWCTSICYMKHACILSLNILTCFRYSETQCKWVVLLQLQRPQICNRFAHKQGNKNWVLEGNGKGSYDMQSE